MSQVLPTLTDTEQFHTPETNEAGYGTVATPMGPLPLQSLHVRTRIDGLMYRTTIEQSFANPHPQAIEATYLFPLPDRAAVTSFRLKVADRVIEAQLYSKAEAEQRYREAIQAGHRAAMTEQHKANVFALKVGNLPPADRVQVELHLVGSLQLDEGEATYRFPLVVAPRYEPAAEESSPQQDRRRRHSGTRTSSQRRSRTEPPPPPSPPTAVPPSASLPADDRGEPVYLPGQPSAVRLSLQVEVHPTHLPMREFRSSLHTVEETRQDNVRIFSLRPGERLDRDFILRFRVGTSAQTTTLLLQPDADPSNQGTWVLTLLADPSVHMQEKPRDLVLILDRSGSMGGWKMSTSRRALARIVETLSTNDRLAILAFDNVVERPPGWGTELVPVNERHRSQAMRFLLQLEARGGTDLAQPLNQAIRLLQAADLQRDRILFLVTDGQVGNEDALLAQLGERLRGLRVFTLGVDQAVNEGFLNRLAQLGGGYTEIVESEDRAEAVMERIHRRISTPALTDLSLSGVELHLLPEFTTPGRLADVFVGTPWTVLGRYEGPAQGAIRIHASDEAGMPWTCDVPAQSVQGTALAQWWASAFLNDPTQQAIDAERKVEISRRFGVLAPQTAFVAVDVKEVVNPGGQVEKVMQPLEIPAGWEWQLNEASPPVLYSPTLTRGVTAHHVAYFMLSSMEIDSLFEAPTSSPKAFGLLPGASSVVSGVKSLLQRLVPGRSQSASDKADSAACDSTPDLTAFRQRATQLHDQLLHQPPTTLRQLGAIAQKIQMLLEDLRSVQAPERLLTPIADFLTRLRQRLSSNPHDLSDLPDWIRQTHDVLEAFLKG